MTAELSLLCALLTDAILGIMLWIQGVLYCLFTLVSVQIVRDFNSVLIVRNLPFLQGVKF